MDSEGKERWQRRADTDTGTANRRDGRLSQIGAGNDCAYLQVDMRESVQLVEW